MDKKDKELREFLKNNSSKIPQAPVEEWSHIQRQLNSTGSLWRPWKFILPIGGLVAASLLVLLVLPNINSKPEQQNIQIAEFMWDSYSYVDELEYEADDDLYWELNR